MSPPDPATLARTALAATHGGRLTLPGRASQDVGYLDDDGEPLLVVHGDASQPRGPACLSVVVASVTAGPHDRVVLGGQLQAYGESMSLDHVLGVHARCFLEAMHDGPVALVRLVVDAVRIEEGGHTTIVSCASYAAADPDLWSAFAHEVASHLERDHGDVLTQIARLHLPGQHVVAAGIARLRPEALTLDIVTAEGASRVDLALGVRLDDPHELCGRLVELTTPTQRSPGRRTAH